MSGTDPLLEQLSEVLVGVDESGFVESGQSDQQLLRAGKISLEEFLDLSVDRATNQLADACSPEQLQSMREILRQELESDPTLMAYVQQIGSGSAASTR